MPKRPVGIGILSIFNLIIGILVTLTLAILFLIDIQKYLTRSNIWLLMVGIMFTLSSILLWKKKRWGWWLTSFLFVYTILDTVAFGILENTLEFGYGSIIVTYVSLTIIYYIFRKNTLEYLEMHEESMANLIESSIMGGIMLEMANYFISTAPSFLVSAYS